MRHLPQLTLLAALAAAPSVRSEAPDYARDVRPILSRYCFKCHGPDEEGRKGKLRLDVRDAALAPAKSGAKAIVPGHVSESELVTRILTDDLDEIMPPPAAKQEMTAAQKDILRRWVEAGAPYAGHWAFEAPRRPAVPAVEPPAAGAIDAFVRDRLRQENLPTSPPADAATLFRRVSYDLTGLPPEPEAIAAAVRAEAQNPGQLPALYEAYVDQLLASPHYGERWARKWLDLARYADTNGYEKDRPRQIWPWRDWVVQALNADMPFDQFTVEQLAGDMLPNATAQQVIATGFHRNTMLNEEGGIDPLEFRYHAMTDRVATTGATWMGLTLQCAQCHTHKYDPIPHREYFQVMAMLNNADEPDFTIPAPDAEKKAAQRETRRRQLIAALPDQWPAGEITWSPAPPAEVTAEPAEKAERLADGSVLLPPSSPESSTLTLSLTLPPEGTQHLRLEALADPSLPKSGPGRTPHGNFVLSEITLTDDAGAVDILSATATAEQSGYPVAHAFDKNTGTGWAVHEGGKNLNETKTAVFHLKRKAAGRLTVKLYQQLGKGHTMGRVRLSTGAAAAASSPRQAMEAAFTAWLASQRSGVTPWTPLAPAKAVSNLPLLTTLPDASVLASGDISKSDTYGLTFKTTQQNITAIRLEALPHSSLPANGPGMTYYEGPKGDFFMGEFQISAAGQPVKLASATHSYAKNNFGQNVSAAAATDGDAQTGWSTSGGEGKAHEAVFVFEKPFTPAGGEFSLRMLFGRHYACSLGRFRISLTTSSGPVASANNAEIQALLAKQDATLSESERTELRTAFLLQAPELAAARKEIEALSRPPGGQTTLVMRERPPENPRPTFVHHRGEYTQPKEKVEPGVLSMLPPLPADAPRNRLSFARWLVSRENPLTARVVVNRHWASFFGRGLVKTQEDFGLQGDLPTHPALLDWLAVEFMESGWTVKKLHRLIVMSATYRQSSRVAGPGAEKDHENLLLWRGPRHRLEAEQIRDAALAVTGLLSTKMGGPGVYPPQPASVTTEGTYGAMQWATSSGDDRYRRSLYTFIKRTAPFAMSNTFDAPTGEACVARRDVSNTPLQSLTLLNDVMFMEAAQGMAKNIAASAGTTEEKLHRLIYRLYSRPAQEAEIADIAAFHQAQKARAERGELDAAKTAGEGANADRAAWTLTIRALLNTDEFVTKN